MSSSTSYYTNSPSPPQGEQALRASQLLAQGDALQPLQLHPALRASQLNLAQPEGPAQCLPHSSAADGAHSDSLVLSRNQFEQMSGRLEELASRVASLERTLAADVRTILGILQGQGKDARAEVSL